MQYSLRLPIVKVIDKTKIQINSKGSKTELLLLICLKLLATLTFGFAVFIYHGLTWGIAFAAFIFFIMAIPVYMAFKTPKNFIFDIKNSTTTKLPLFGPPELSQFDPQTLTFAQNRYGKHYVQELAINFNNYPTIVNKQADKPLSKATFLFIIELLNQSHKYKDTQKGFLAATNDISAFEEAFVECFNPSTFEKIKTILYKAILYFSAVALFSFVGLLLLLGIIMLIRN